MHASIARGQQLDWREYAKLARLSPDEIVRDCEVDVFHATGPGGQGVNTADSAVRMRHVPSGIVVVSRASRSQLQNRRDCLAKLHDLFVHRAHPPRPRQSPHTPPRSAGSRPSASVASARPSARGGVSSRDPWVLRGPRGCPYA